MAEAGYLNLHRLMNCEYVAIAEIDDGYFLRAASSFEIENFGRQKSALKFGEIGKNNLIWLTEVNDFLFSKGSVQVTVDLDKNYVEMKPCKTNKYPPPIFYRNQHGPRYLQKLKKVMFCISEHDFTDKVIRIPTAFLKQCGATRGDILPVHLEKDRVIIESKPAKCSVCGAEISRYQNDAACYTACASCHQKLVGNQAG